MHNTCRNVTNMYEIQLHTYIFEQENKFSCKHLILLNQLIKRSEPFYCSFVDDQYC